MSNGHEEQNALNRCKEIIKETMDKLGLDNININTNVVEPIENGIKNSNIRIRTDNTIPKTSVVEERPINSFYTSVPTYSIKETPSNIGSNKAAFAAVLLVTEILALIILVTLVTFVAFYGLS